MDATVTRHVNTQSVGVSVSVYVTVGLRNISNNKDLHLRKGPPVCVGIKGLDLRRTCWLIKLLDFDPSEVSIGLTIIVLSLSKAENPGLYHR